MSDSTELGSTVVCSLLNAELRSLAPFNLVLDAVLNELYGECAHHN